MKEAFNHMYALMVNYQENGIDHWYEVFQQVFGDEETHLFMCWLCEEIIPNKRDSEYNIDGYDDLINPPLT